MITGEFDDAVLRVLFTRLTLTGNEYTFTALAPVADAIVERTKQELAQPSDYPGRASPGAPPGYRSRSLQNSIGRDPISRLGPVASTLVGTRTGYQPGYSRKPANLYGLYLETVSDHAFLAPVADLQSVLAIPGYYAEVYDSPVWRTLY
jgi:hypothetical protein